MTWTNFPKNELPQGGGRGVDSRLWLNLLLACLFLAALGAGLTVWGAKSTRRDAACKISNGCLNRLEVFGLSLAVSGGIGALVVVARGFCQRNK